MKKLVALLTVGMIVLGLVPLASAQTSTTNTGVQVVNLSSTTTANITFTYYRQNGTTLFFNDTIDAGGSKVYAQASEPTLSGEATFNGSVVISADQPVAAIVNQSTASSTGGYRFNGSYTGFSQGSTSFYVPVALRAYYNFSTEISVQNAGTGPVDVDVTYSTTGCTDSMDALPAGAVVRFDNTATCSGALESNGSATITATGPVVAVVNQMNKTANKEQTYNGFAPADAGPVLYSPIALRAYYTFNSAFQVQNVSGAAMDITVTYSDGISRTITGVADGAAAMFAQTAEAHALGWAGSAKVTNSTGGNMVGIVNQSNPAGKASSFNMFTSGANRWVLPSLLRAYYGYNSGYQIQNVGDTAVTVNVTYSDGQHNMTGVVIEPGQVAGPYAQTAEADHGVSWSGSAVVESTGPIVIVVNQDAPGEFDRQYAYNAVPVQ
ncbi:MAG: hypothetical protein JW850_06785 [Thermoflexales bacterium]|nr:hypothetical protein [Thermoflexales bacterium]